MTVNYNSAISSGSKGVFLKLLMIWRASLYKLVWVDLLIYIALYVFINILYHFVLDETSKSRFEDLVLYFAGKMSSFPISFLLGFFVSGVIGRWWTLFYSIPWLNKFAFVSQSYIIGKGEEDSRTFRLLLMRYINLAWVLAMLQVSDQLRNRFKLSKQGHITVQSVLRSINDDPKVKRHFKRLVTEEEMEAFVRIARQRPADGEIDRLKYGLLTPSTSVNEPEYWVPLQWAVRLMQKSVLHGYVSDPKIAANLIDEINRLREELHRLILNSCIVIPLVYTQVVIIAIFTYFLCNLFAEQFLSAPKTLKARDVKLVFPVLNVFQFLFILGWFKVAMCAMNPFGDDDEDFETSAMLDYNLEMTQRSAGALEELFPSSLEYPAVDYKSENPGRDNLQEFIAKASSGISYMEPMSMSDHADDNANLSRRDRFCGDNVENRVNDGLLKNLA